MKLIPINADNAPASVGYAQAMLVTGATRTLYVSGQIPADRDGVIPATFEEQSRLCWANVIAQLHAAGMTLDNLVKVTMYLANRDHIAEYRKVRAEVLGGRPIALTTIITGIFNENWLLEIEAIAAA